MIEQHNHGSTFAIGLDASLGLSNTLGLKAVQRQEAPKTSLAVSGSVL